MGIREQMKERAKNEKAVKGNGQGINMNAGARYRLTVKGVKVFKGHKSPLQGVAEFTVKSVTRTQPEDFFKDHPYPNEVGSTCSDALNLMDDYKSTLFYKIISAISHESIDELLKPLDTDPNVQTFEELVQFDNGPASVLVGLEVDCEAFLKPNQSNTKMITAKIYSPVPAPADHPLASLINGTAA